MGAHQGLSHQGPPNGDRGGGHMYIRLKRMKITYFDQLTFEVNLLNDLIIWRMDLEMLRVDLKSGGRI